MFRRFIEKKMRDLITDFYVGVQYVQYVQYLYRLLYKQSSIHQSDVGLFLFSLCCVLLFAELLFYGCEKWEPLRNRILQIRNRGQISKIRSWLNNVSPEVVQVKYWTLQKIIKVTNNKKALQRLIRPNISSILRYYLWCR